MDPTTYSAVGAGVAIGVAGSQIVERVGKLIMAVLAEKRKEIADRRKAVLDATVALVTTKQTTDKDYYAGDVSSLFTRLMYLMENDGSAWDRAEFHAEAHGKHFDGLPPEKPETK